MTNPAITNAKRVAFQGEAGAFSNLAAREAVPNASAIPAADFASAIEAVKNGDCDLCVIPVENSLHGRIADIHHLLPDAGLHIVGEHFQRIHHQLLGVKGAKIEGLKNVYSQAPAIGQCLKIIRELKLVMHNWHDTAGSARHVAERKDPANAAIASSLAGELYGLEVLRANVEDADHNTTRFLLLSREAITAPPDVPAITSFVFRVRNVPAALYKAMGGFASNGVNITKLESYQLGGSFNATQFYADIEGHIEDEPVRRAFAELAKVTSRVTILGSYPSHPFRAQMP
ncbi:MAG TPA: prephenate dehydratase [Rhizomicrobium sp.]